MVSETERIERMKFERMLSLFKDWQYVDSVTGEIVKVPISLSSNIRIKF